MERKEVIERFCKLSTEVNEKKFGFEFAADCFCGKNNMSGSGYRFDEEIMEFIENTVRDALSV